MFQGAVHCESFILKKFVGAFIYNFNDLQFRLIILIHVKWIVFVLNHCNPKDKGMVYMFSYKFLLGNSKQMVLGFQIGMPSGDMNIWRGLRI